MPLGQVYAATFSNNGEWLCAWYNQNASLHWSIWEMKTIKQRAHEVYLPKFSQGQSSALRRVLIPFNHHPCFAACDQHGNLSIFQKNSRQTCDMPVEGLEFGLVTPNDDAIVLVRNKHSLWKPCLKIDFVFETQKSGKLDSKTVQELHCEIDPKTCGIAIRGQDTNIWLLECLCDGYIVRRKLV